MSVPATVPGNFEIDLERAGRIEDIFFGNNVLESQKRENYHLWYVKEFTIKEAGNYQLIFEGIDTIADIYLNGAKIGSCKNMLISHAFDIDKIRLGKNQLVVHIKPTFLEARQKALGAGVVNHQPYNAESLLIRKPAHTYGWDIMPRILSGGIWKSVMLADCKEEYIEETYLRTCSISSEAAILRFYYQTAITGDFINEYSIYLYGKCKDSEITKKIRLWNTSGTVDFKVENPHLWWTRDMGEQNLYEVTVRLCHFNETIDTKTFSFGIRKFELKRSSLADENSEFCFILNGEPLFVRGTNWVPLDALHSRDEQRLPKALELLYEANCNMVRCWGGNVYENERFFEFCDRHGIAVWQDFAMGCATYPLSREMCEALETEITAVVKKYRQYTCLAIWAGDNECDEASAFWAAGGLDPNRNILTRKTIPWILAQHDPERCYLPSSPYIDRDAYISGDGGNTPEKHLWGPRDYFKSDYYTTANAKFASETGYHGCPAPMSVEKFISKEKLWPWQNNDEWLSHASCMETGEKVTYAYRIPLMAKQVKVLFGEEPDSLERFAMMSQASQAEADKYFVERFRSGKWDRTGIIWWNLIDGWPQFSDAVVDYYYAKKLAFHILKRSQQPVCLMFREPVGDCFVLVGANEYRKQVEVSYEVTDHTDKKILLRGTVKLNANAATEINNVVINDGKMHFLLIKWEIDNLEYSNYYVVGQAPYNFDEYYRNMIETGMWETEGF